MDPVLVTVIVKFFGSALLALGGIIAILSGVKLYRDGAGLKKERSSFDVYNRIFRVKVTTSSIGAVLMVTSVAWGYFAWQALPSYEAGIEGTKIVTIMPTPEAGKAPTLYVGEPLFFESASADLTDESKNKLSVVAKGIEQFPDIKLTVEGHAGEKEGSQEKALVLSEDRARAVTNYIITRGIEKERIKTIGLGTERPRPGLLYLGRDLPSNQIVVIGLHPPSNDIRTQ